MITVSLLVSESSASTHIRVRAANLARAIRIAGDGRPGVRVELLAPLDLIDSIGAVAPAAVSEPSRPKIGLVS